MGDLTQHFSRAEFACRDGCGYDGISLDLVNRLQVARRLANLPFLVNSGCRCVHHNIVVGGVRDSAHLTGLAADIACRSSRTRYWVLLGLYGAGFTRLTLYHSWVHVDIDRSKDQDVLALP